MLETPCLRLLLLQYNSALLRPCITQQWINPETKGSLFRETRLANRVQLLLTDNLSHEDAVGEHQTYLPNGYLT